MDPPRRQPGHGAGGLLRRGRHELGEAPGTGGAPGKQVPDDRMCFLGRCQTLPKTLETARVEVPLRVATEVESWDPIHPNEPPWYGRLQLSLMETGLLEYSLFEQIRSPTACSPRDWMGPHLPVARPFGRRNHTKRMSWVRACFLHAHTVAADAGRETDEGDWTNIARDHRDSRGRLPCSPAIV